MTWFEIAIMVVSAFATGWFLSAAVHCHPLGHSWKLVREWLASVALYTCFIVCANNVSFWLNYHHLVDWRSDAIVPMVWSSMAAWMTYREAKRQKVKILNALNLAQADTVK